MPRYTPPLRDMQFVLHELLQVEQVMQTLTGQSEVTRELVDQVLAEAGRFASEVLQPLNQTGDRQGCRHDRDTHAVTTPDGFAAAYHQFCEGGWTALASDPDFGGQGLPAFLNNSVYEMLNSANQAWTMYPGLTHGAYECLHAHGSPTLKQRYLPHLVSGKWTASMCLTESQCGTDLGMLRTRAEPRADGSYGLTGNKIFISSGEHDMAHNIVHLVLARLPDAPEGTRGISLFIVPKFLPGESGAADSLGARNGVTCGGLEHKMGIHGNATCQINFDNAAGWLIGEPHRGLQAMFVMMNQARLGVGVQSLGLTEVAYQNAVDYARDRVQSRSLTGAKAPDKPADPIIVHPDVRRMLLTARAYAEGGRALACLVALELDRERHHPDQAVRAESAAMVSLLTPVVKAFLTDNGFTAVSESMQVYGGHGYIAEWGMEQFVRDARINMIYEGTNTIQSLDLLGRKVLQDNGVGLKLIGRRIRQFVEENGLNEGLSEFITPLADIGEKVVKLTAELGMKAFQNRDEVGAAAVPYLRVIGHMAFAYLFAVSARIALEKQAAGDPFYTAKLATARFYFQRMLPETAMLIRQARAGSASLMEMDASLF